MPLLRIPFAILFTSIFILHTSAQTPTSTPAPPAATTPNIFVIPTILKPIPLYSIGPINPSNFKIEAAQITPKPTPKITLKPTLSAQTHAPCYTLRAYRFTTKDLQSPIPHASSSTDCTPASSNSFKAAQAIIVK